jgi:hypothetical protein
MTRFRLFYKSKEHITLQLLCFTLLQSNHQLFFISLFTQCCEGCGSNLNTENAGNVNKNEKKYFIIKISFGFIRFGSWQF